MNAERVVKNAVFNSSAWIITVFVNLAATPYIVQKLTPEGYGIYALLTGFIGYYNLLDLGLGQGITKFVAQYKGTADYAAINRSIDAAIWVQIITGAIGSCCIVVGAETIISLMNISPAYHDDALIGLYVSAIGFFLTMLTGTLSSVLMGLQRYDITSKVHVTANSLLTVSVVALLLFGNGLREIIFVTAAFALPTFILYLKVVRRELPSWNFSWSFDKNSFKTLFHFSGFMFISQVANLFSNYVVRFVISFFVGPAAVTSYVVPTKLISAFGGLLSSGFGVLFPYASELGAINARAAIQNNFVHGSKLFAIISVPVLLMMSIFSGPILELWMGPEFPQEAATVLQILSLAGLLGSLTTVPNTIIMGLGFARLVAMFSLFTILLYVVFLPWFTLKWGVQGTAWAILMASIPGLVLISYETRVIMKLSVLYYLKRTLGFHVVPLAIGFAIAIFGPIHDPQHSTSAVVIGLVCLFVYYFMMYILKWIPAERLHEQIKTFVANK